MEKEFSNKTSSRSSFFIGIIMGIIGLVFMAFNTLIGGAILVIGVVVFFLMRNFGSDTIVSFHEDRFIVKVINKSKGNTVNEYKWSDVTETHYYEKESSGEDSTTTQFFQVKTEKGVAFTLYASKGFSELIETVNQQTAHLPYVWEKKKGLSGTYIKKERSLS